MHSAYRGNFHAHVTARQPRQSRVKISVPPNLAEEDVVEVVWGHGQNIVGPDTSRVEYGTRRGFVDDKSSAVGSWWRWSARVVMLFVTKIDRAPIKTEWPILRPKRPKATHLKHVSCQLAISPQTLAPSCHQQPSRPWNTIVSSPVLRGWPKNVFWNTNNSTSPGTSKAPTISVRNRLRTVKTVFISVLFARLDKRFQKWFANGLCRLNSQPPREALTYLQKTPLVQINDSY
jgi:hypothetical protein